MARPGLTTHRKFRRLALKLESAALARGFLELIWETCYESGNDYLGTATDIENLVGWKGECGALAAALREVGAPEGAGFIEVVTEGAHELSTTYRVHDLWHHAPDYVTKRHKRELERRQKVAPTVKRRRTAPNGVQRPPSPDSQTEVDRTPAPAPAPAHSPQSAHAQKRASVAALFARFWDAYPRHEKRSLAEQAFAKLKPDDALLVKMLAALEWQTRQPKWLKDNGEYVPYPTSWLNQRRWEDEPFEPPAEVGRSSVPDAGKTRALLEDAGFRS